MRWDLIEKFEVLKKGEYAVAVKSFTGREDFFSEHFPDDPLVPEPLFVEMIAQAGGVLFGLGLDFKKEVILAKILHASFSRPVRPPCSFRVEARIDEEREEGAWVSGSVKLGDETIAKASILLVTIDSLAENKKKVVFNDDFLEHFDVYNVARASEERSLSKRVVITGLGAITAIGEGAEVLWQAAIESKSGIQTARVDEHLELAGGFIKDFDPEKFVTQPKALKVMARDIQLAVAAASLALDDANAKNLSESHERYGVIVGSGVLNHELDELAYSIQSSLGDDGNLNLRKFGSEGMSALFPLWLLKYLPNMPACHISILFDFEGPNNTLTTGASAGLQAVGEACRIIQRGAADVMLAGAAESKVNPVGMSQYQVLGVLNETNGCDPRKAYRPFDASAGGFVVGEGSGFLVLEELEHAKKRGAKIYAEITGFGSSGYSGQKLAMQAALKEAKISAEGLDYLQASGLGIAKEDALEARAIQDVFNGSSSGLWVSASKPVMGFTGFSSGTLDLIISTLSLKNQLIPPTMNFERSAQDLGFRLVKDKPLKKTVRHAMTNAFGFNGQCVSMVTKAYEGN